MLGPDDEFADALAKADRAMYARKAQRRGNILPPCVQAEALTQ
jgi:hypothetical protein